jgi:DHA2 family multidrug resistance protein-like MFS transporter
MFLSAPADRSAAAGGLQGTARLAGQTAGAVLVALVLSAFPLSTAPQVAIGLAAAAALSAAWVSRAPSGNPATEDHAPAAVTAG